LERVNPSVWVSATISCTRLASGTATTAGGFAGTDGSKTSGFGPVAFQPPKYFPITCEATSGVVRPMTTMVVKSGRKTLR
jgi:hypothetical protein